MSKYLNLKPVEFDALGKKTQAAFKWEGRILLPKYDGCFAMVAFNNGHPAFVMSRTGEVVKSMDHIFEDLLVTYPHLANTKGGWMVLGEAWTPGKEFAELSGTFRRQYAQPGLGFAPFDLVRYVQPADLPVLSSPHPYRERLSLLSSGRRVLPSVTLPTAVVCQGAEHALQYARNLKDLGGYDGAIASDPEAAYTPGAGKAGEFVKLKPLVTYSLEVVDVLRTVGEKTGRPIGTPVVRFKEGTCGVGTGFSADEALAWFNDPRQIIGKIIEVEAMGVSSKGLLREPRYKGIRDDVTKADY